MSFPRSCCSWVAEQECLFILCVWCLQAKHQLMIELKALVVIARTLPWAFWPRSGWVPLVHLVEWHRLRAASQKRIQEMAVGHLAKWPVCFGLCDVLRFKWFCRSEGQVLSRSLRLDICPLQWCKSLMLLSYNSFINLVSVFLWTWSCNYWKWKKLCASDFVTSMWFRPW